MDFKKMKLGKNGKFLRETSPPEKPVSYAIDIMEKYIKVDINQDQFDALVSLICHLGEKVFASSIILAALNEGNYIQAGHNFAYVGRITKSERLRKKEGSIFNGVFG